MANNGQLPGTTINQQFNNVGSSTRDFPRYTALICKSLPIKYFGQQQLVRGALTGIPLTFSSITFQALLPFSALPDKTRAVLKTGDGRSVSAQNFNFIESTPGSGVFDTIVIDSARFNPQSNYTLDYISNDPAVNDELPVDDIRELTQVGDNSGAINYVQGKDFFLDFTTTGPTPGTGNEFPTQMALTAPVKVTSAGTGTMALHSGAAYTHQYNRTYVATVTAAAGVTPTRTATVMIESFPTSGGYNVGLPRTVNQQNAITVSLSEAIPASLTNVAAEYGITLDFTFGASNFLVGDVFHSMYGNGPGVLELGDSLQNTNQFASTSNVIVEAAVGTGTVAVNPQSVYNGLSNKTYELECTSVFNDGINASSRTATFRWRATAENKLLTGIVTATNGSAVVTGSGTLFTNEVAAGDVLFVGTNDIPVTVLSVGTTGTLTLTAPYTGTTAVGVKVLRVRQHTAVFTVTALAPSRVTFDSGIFLDFSYGGPLLTNNFSVGDKFAFTAQTARTFYTAENRSYDFSVQAIDPHAITLNYTGSTTDAGFGTTIVSEGNPLVLPNNVVVYARNLSMATRYSAASPQDIFDLSVALTGTIDWELDATNSETFASSSIQRDLTGQITGTAGNYYIVLRKKPLSVLYVRGPSPTFTNFAYNLVPNSNIVYFTINPGVNITVAYRYAGNEPQTGAAYFISGYAGRPASDYTQGHLFFSRAEAQKFLAPCTPLNDAYIANEIAWDQDENNLPGVVVFLVKDAGGQGQFFTTDYENAIQVFSKFKPTCDAVVVNNFDSRDTMRDTTVSKNDPRVARQCINYLGFPIGFPIGDAFTPGSRVFTALREMQVFEQTPARGTIAIVGAAQATKTIQVNAIGDGIVTSTPTQVTLDGSFVAVALAARVSSFAEPWQTILNTSVSGFDSIEKLDEDQLIQLDNAGIIPIRVNSDASAVYCDSTTVDTTEPSTSELSGTVQRQYMLARLKNVSDTKIANIVYDSPEEFAALARAELSADIGTAISLGKIGKYIDPTTQQIRPLDPSTDVKAYRDPKDPTRGFWAVSWYNKYPVKRIQGLIAVDQPLS